MVGRQWVCTNRLEGKTIVITGANSGIGKATAIMLANRGARIIMACRNLGSANGVKEEIMSAIPNKNIEVQHLDLSSMSSVRKFAKALHKTEEKIDVLINNAGAAGLADKKTEDGLQILMAINHFGPFLLTNLLLDLIRKAPEGRIIYVSSTAHRFHKFDINNLNCEKFTAGHWQLYCNCKLANIMTANYLAKQLQHTNVTVNSLHPGFINTNIIRRLKGTPLTMLINIAFKLFGKTPEEGAMTLLYLAASYEVEKVTGKYFSNCQESKCISNEALDTDLAEKVWKKSEELVKLKPEEKFL